MVLGMIEPSNNGRGKPKLSDFIRAKFDNGLTIKNRNGHVEVLNDRRGIFYFRRDLDGILEIRVYDSDVWEPAKDFKRDFRKVYGEDAKIIDHFLVYPGYCCLP